MSPTRTPRPAYRYRQREAARRKHRRRVALLVAGGVAVVVVLAAVIASSVGGSSSKTSAPTGAEAADIVRNVTSVPLSTSDPIGSGSATQKPIKLTGQPLTADGKPQFLYIGAEFCPFCAAERWAMVVALSRFGTFSNLGFTRSSGTDVFANTPTFTFHGSSYTSPYLTFTPVETATRDNAPLDTPTADQLTAWQTLDPKQTIPFLDIGGLYQVSGATYDPTVLQGKSHKEIADALNDANSPIAKAVLGAANDLTAAICKTTNDQPANVCGSAAIKAIEGQLP